MAKGKSKTVQIEYHSGGSATIHYFLDDQLIGKKEFEKVPKRLAFFVEKFPQSSDEVQSSDLDSNK